VPLILLSFIAPYPVHNFTDFSVSQPVLHYMWLSVRSQVKASIGLKIYYY
jgi:hypothetical protein